MPEKQITVKSLHPIPHTADIMLGAERVVITFEGSAAIPVSARIARILQGKRDNAGKPMYEVTGLDPAPAAKPAKEAVHVGNQ